MAGVENVTLLFRDLQLLQGFVPIGANLRTIERKNTALRLRARSAAARMALSSGLRFPLRTLADEIGVSERTLHVHFAAKEALLAFPPPEFAIAIVNTTVPARSWSQARARLAPLFEALDNNVAGKEFLTTLAALHERHEHLRQMDAHFAVALRAALAKAHTELAQIAAPWAGFFTDALRTSLLSWSLNPTDSLLSVHRDICDLIESAPIPDSSHRPENVAASGGVRSHLQLAGRVDAKHRS